MKTPLLSALTVFTVLGLSQPAKAYNLEACAKDPMTSAPQTINLLQPIDQKMMNCIPKLDSIASQWQSKANGILSAIKGVKIGNQGESDIEKLEYNITGNTISLVAKVRAKHTGTGSLIREV
jgi:peptidoglycan hydrolase CwlO-like protein